MSDFPPPGNASWKLTPETHNGRLHTGLIYTTQTCVCFSCTPKEYKQVKCVLCTGYKCFYGGGLANIFLFQKILLQSLSVFVTLGRQGNVGVFLNSKLP